MVFYQCSYSGSQNHGRQLVLLWSLPGTLYGPLHYFVELAEKEAQVIVLMVNHKNVTFCSFFIQGSPPYVFYFRVRFFVSDPAKLSEDLTRYSNM